MFLRLDHMAPHYDKIMMRCHMQVPALLTCSVLAATYGDSHLIGMTASHQVRSSMLQCT